MLKRLHAWFLVCPKMWLTFLCSYSWLAYSYFNPFEIASAGATIVCSSILGEIFLQNSKWKDPKFCTTNSGQPVRITEHNGSFNFHQGNVTCVSIEIDKNGNSVSINPYEHLCTLALPHEKTDDDEYHLNSTAQRVMGKLTYFVAISAIIGTLIWGYFERINPELQIASEQTEIYTLPMKAIKYAQSLSGD